MYSGAAIMRPDHTTTIVIANMNRHFLNFAALSDEILWKITLMLKASWYMVAATIQQSVS